MECCYCHKVSKNHNSHINHERMCPKNPNRNPLHIGNGRKFRHGDTPWNKDLSKDSDERIRNGILTFQENEKKGIHKKDYYQTKEYKEIKSRQAKEQGLGGVRPSCRVHYNGITLGSTYELEVAESLDENEVKWEVGRRFKYTDNNGKERSYTPDFYLPKYDIYLDPKNNFLIENINPSLGFKDEDKIRWVCEQNKIVILILDKESLSWEKILSRIILVRGGDRL